MEVKKDLKQIKEFVDLVNTTDIVELLWEKEGTKIGFKRDEDAIDQKKRGGGGIEKEPRDKEISETKPRSPEDEYTTIKSKMVGTFYIAPSQDSEPYVKVGETVKAGQKVCMIEAMKVMREITMSQPARIVKILIENGHPVEYGQNMFLVDTKLEGEGEGSA